MSKVFNSVNHGVLLNKLEYLQINGNFNRNEGWYCKLLCLLKNRYQSELIVHYITESIVDDATLSLRELLTKMSYFER